MLDEIDFFPKTTYFRPTETWQRAWRRNLARAPRQHTAEASLAIKHAVWDWREADPHSRPLQEELAASLGVSKQYVNRLVHTLPPRITLPPARHAPAPKQPEPVVRDVLEGHGWNCECIPCKAYARIQAAIREAKRIERP